MDCEEKSEGLQSKKLSVKHDREVANTTSFPMLVEGEAKWGQFLRYLSSVSLAISGVYDYKEACEAVQ